MTSKPLAREDLKGKFNYTYYDLDSGCVFCKRKTKITSVIEGENPFNHRKILLFVCKKHKKEHWDKQDLPPTEKEKGDKGIGSDNKVYGRATESLTAEIGGQVKDQILEKVKEKILANPKGEIFEYALDGIKNSDGFVKWIIDLALKESEGRIAELNKKAVKIEAEHEEILKLHDEIMSLPSRKAAVARIKNLEKDLKRIVDTLLDLAKHCDELDSKLSKVGEIVQSHPHLSNSKMIALEKIDKIKEALK